MIVALIALFVALSGGAAAGTYLAANNAQKVSAASRGQAAAIAHLTKKLGLSPALRGPRGPRGPRGFRGPAGGFKTSNITYVAGAVVHMCALGGGTCAIGSSTATCPSGKVALGGGWIGETSDPPVLATAAVTSITTNGAGWGVVMINDNDAGTASFHAVAACAG
jgi:hypothetical protein